PLAVARGVRHRPPNHRDRPPRRDRPRSSARSLRTGHPLDVRPDPPEPAAIILMADKGRDARRKPNGFTNPAGERPLTPRWRRLLGRSIARPSASPSFCATGPPIVRAPQPVPVRHLASGPTVRRRGLLDGNWFGDRSRS